MSKLVFELRDFLKPDPVNIDNTTFRLHYKVTRLALLIIVIAVGTQQYAGDPMECIGDQILKRETINNYCWIHATYTNIVSADYSAAHPGISLPNASSRAGEKYHKYYQWVIFMLLLQAVLFHLPYYLWVSWEQGRMKDLVTDLIDPIGEPEKRVERKRLLTDFLTNLNIRHDYALKFFFCELLNLINVTGQIFLLNKFLDYQFTTYGFEIIDILNDDPQHRADTMDRVFPKVGKCTFNRTGSSGNIVSHDNLCVLPINNTNEKIYVFIWVWLLLLAALTILATIFRVLTMTFVEIRAFLLCRKSLFNDHNQCHWIARRLSFSDWFILMQIGSNVDATVFAELVEDLYTNLSRKKKKLSVNEKDGMTPLKADHHLHQVVFI